VDGITFAGPLFYELSEVFHPQRAAGVRWNDPAFGVDRPDAVRVMLEHDKTFSDSGV